MSKFGKKKIIVHNLTFPECGRYTGVMDYDQRGILSAGSTDVVVAKNKPSKYFLNYLTLLGWNFSKVVFIFPKSKKNYKYDSIFQDNNIINKLKNLNGYYLDTYQLTEKEAAFAKKINAPLYGNERVASQYGTKSGFKKLCKEEKLPTTLGFENLKSAKKVYQKINLLFKEKIKIVAIKSDIGVSGSGIILVYANDYKKLSEKNKNKKIKYYLDELSNRTESKAFLVEEWVTNAISSPACIVHIGLNKKIKITTIYDQILDKNENSYLGCSYPVSNLSSSLIEDIKVNSLKLARRLMKEGFYGYCGIDFISTGDSIKLIEANIRKTGTYYPEQIIDKLLHDVENREKISYISYAFFVNEFIGEDFIFLHKIFKNLLFIKGKKTEGVFLFNTGALKSSGRFDVVCFSYSRKKTEQLLKKVNDRISSYKKLFFYKNKLKRLIKKIFYFFKIDGYLK